MSFDVKLKGLIDKFTSEVLSAVSQSTLQEIMELAGSTKTDTPVRKKRKYTRRKKVAEKTVSDQQGTSEKPPSTSEEKIVETGTQEEEKSSETQG